MYMQAVSFVYVWYTGELSGEMWQVSIHTFLWYDNTMPAIMIWFHTRLRILNAGIKTKILYILSQQTCLDWTRSVNGCFSFYIQVLQRLQHIYGINLSSFSQQLRLKWICDNNSCLYRSTSRSELYTLPIYISIKNNKKRDYSSAFFNFRVTNNMCNILQHLDLFKTMTSYIAYKIRYYNN